MSQFQDTVQRLVEGMNRHASRIEAAKLKALGQRNRVESEKEVRKIKKNELESLIKDKKDLLERLQLQVLAHVLLRSASCYYFSAILLCSSSISCSLITDNVNCHLHPFLLLSMSP